MAITGLTFALGLVTSGCATGNQSRAETTSSSTLQTTVTTVTTTSAPELTVAEKLAEVLNDRNFSAEIDFVTMGRNRAGDFSERGSGAISGPDSRYRIEYDFSTLTTTVLDPEGRLVGPGGLSSRVDDSRVVDGRLYESLDDGRWLLLEDSGNTTLGHIFDRLRSVGSFEDVGVETIEGEELHHLVPASDPALDPSYWRPDRSSFDDFSVSTHIYTDELGTPRQLTLEISFGGRLPAEWSEVFRLSNVGEPVEIGLPDEVWKAVSAEDLSSLKMFNLLVPESWTVVITAPRSVVFETTEGYRLLVSNWIDSRLSPQNAMDELLGAYALTAASQEEGDEVFPSQLAFIETEGTAMGFVTTRPITDDTSGVVAFLWSAPREDAADALFDRVLETLVWLNPEATTLMEVPQLGPVRGESLADHVVQTDTLNMLSPILVAQTNCDDLYVAYSDLVAGYADGWSEEWYVDACGTLLVAPITYVVQRGGVISIVIMPIRLLGEDS